MGIFELLILAIIQGITEFLPISSSAHLILPSALIDGFEDQGAMIDVAAHVGTLFAVMLYFRKDVGRLLFGLRDFAQQKPSDDRRLFEVIALGTIPFLFAGTLVALTGLNDHLRSPVVIAWASIGFGGLLWWADRQPEKHTGDISTFKAALLVGLAQCLALIPGTSRSGITITASRFLGYTRTDAARFSMLLAIPAIGASGAYATYDLISEGDLGNIGAAIIIALFSFAAALAAISLFLKATAKISFTPFVIYRIALGLLILWLVT
ncbi:undecaprenyl-diphosphate phosphatase [Parvularcula sp. ZS-1/3]|uniref:Undecaprenyl-diphosphatase n=1 Tax=Parvularcula mediterranea TaxID=2732508 RepID=A0A7Y3RKZ2_9PROT|nr:undecaprenyl-diphosphate phosphatase [Parvularcula mediterranea]NNU15994.1 undecaprenyl-diphosphate phosphatase [Parvularcula mediterranea]